MARPVDTREIPEGYELVAVPDTFGLEWRLETGRRCRALAGYHHPACGQPSAAAMNRGTIAHPKWWAYCELHMYGRWIENGQIMCWILRKKGDGDE